MSAGVLDFARGSILKGCAMKRILALAAIAFVLIVGTAATVTIGSQQAFACDGDHHGV
jgi:hypothetical protein